MASTVTPAPAPPTFLDIVLVVALLVWVTMILIILGFVTIPKDNITLFGSIATGGIVALLTTIVTNRFGSSKSSEAKSDVIATIATNATNGP